MPYIEFEKTIASEACDIVWDKIDVNLGNQKKVEFASRKFTHSMHECKSKEVTIYLLFVGG